MSVLKGRRGYREGWQIKCVTTESAMLLHGEKSKCVHFREGLGCCVAIDISRLICDVMDVSCGQVLPCPALESRCSGCPSVLLGVGFNEESTAQQCLSLVTGSTAVVFVPIDAACSV